MSKYISVLLKYFGIFHFHCYSSNFKEMFLLFFLVNNVYVHLVFNKLLVNDCLTL